MLRLCGIQVRLKSDNKVEFVHNGYVAYTSSSAITLPAVPDITFHTGNMEVGADCVAAAGDETADLLCVFVWCVSD